ncbi:LOW QUALITY PROTEIN: hypothetical protein B0H65DRAFT_558386 [Neurospora tetraspora]|uniref:DUF6536 domain-containing protein n=1 Tax=Neurospora tetraspora TaxID=94610 RepID=A0AAE0JGB7_9PEZI|nr:LOW QUALITY PROTEIN: hypothetical protein B0H65DRAFT_558386 [Neurospora tetraspora]
MFHIRPKRLIMWTTMLVTVLPLHLVFNSAISSTTSTRTYHVLAISPEYLTRPFTVLRDSVIPTVAGQQADANGLLFDLQDTREWRRVNVKSVLIDLEAKGSYYGGVVLVAEQKAIWATRNNMSEPVSGIPYHIIEKATLGSDLHPDWIRAITVMVTTNRTVEDSSEYPHQVTPDRIDPLGYDNWDEVEDQDPFWGHLCPKGVCPFDNPQGGYELDPSTPGFDTVFRIQGNIFVRQVPSRCRLLAEPIFWWLTTFCNIVIAACLSFMAWFYKSTPLVTIGDAIDSFLTEPPSPDSRTIPRSSCTYHYTSFTNIFRPPLPLQAYNPKARPMWKSVSLMRWSLTTAWVLCVLALCGLQFSKALEVERQYASPNERISKSLVTFNLGMDYDHLVYEGDGSTTNMLSHRWRLVLIANTPQVFLSLTYLFLNNILTKMVAEREWHSFHVGTGTKVESESNSKSGKKTWMHRLIAGRIRTREKENETECEPSPTPKTKTRIKTLRTSQPRGSQRSTFFLSLPYRYGLPFVVVSSVMHWLMSQCLYFTEVDFIDLDGVTLDKSNPTTLTLGYSTWAIFWVIVLGTLSWLTILGLAVFGRYPAGMPIMGGCSAVVAAACHRPLTETGRVRERRVEESDDGDGDGDEMEEEGDTDIAAGPLSWGVIKQVVVRDGVEVEEKWLGFTRGEAEKPVVGETYG